MQPMYTGGSESVRAESSRGEFLRATYLHLAGAILAFSALSFVLNAVGLGAAMLKMLGASQYMWLGVLGAFMVVGWLATNMADRAESNQKQLLGLSLYVLAEGVVFAPMFAVAQVVAPDAIPAAALVTLLLCAGLTWTRVYNKIRLLVPGGHSQDRRHVCPGRLWRALSSVSRWGSGSRNHDRVCRGLCAV